MVRRWGCRGCAGGRGSLRGWRHGWSNSQHALRMWLLGGEGGDGGEYWFLAIPNTASDPERRG